MKLYSNSTSPFASRVRVQIYYKDLPIALADPPGGPRSAEYREINPLGLIPALETDDGLISESLAIMEFLEDQWPKPAMRPDTAFGRATLRRVAQYHDARVQPALRGLFGLFMQGGQDPEANATAAAELAEALERLEPVLAAMPGAGGEHLTIADCVLLPTVFFSGLFSERLGFDPVLDRLPELSRRWQTMQGERAAAKVIDELREGIRAMAAGQGAG